MIVILNPDKENGIAVLDRDMRDRKKPLSLFLIARNSTDSTIIPHYQEGLSFDDSYSS